jgi:hypothetical protein
MVASALLVDVTGVTGQSLQRVTGKPDHIKLYRVHLVIRLAGIKLSILAM